MEAIRRLQGRTSEVSARDVSNQTVEIFVKPPKPKPDFPTPTPILAKPKSDFPLSTPTEDSIPPNTKVYAVWFDDDALAYTVNNICILN
jgi:hypothetical protein